MNGTTITGWEQGWRITLEPILFPVWPTLFIFGLWFCLWDIRRALRALPRIRFFLAGPSPVVRSVPDRAQEDVGGPPSPLQRVVNASSRYQAWLLGAVAAKLEVGCVTEEQAATQAAAILQPAGQVVGQPQGQMAGQAAVLVAGQPAPSLLLDRPSLLGIGQMYSSSQDPAMGGAVTPFWSVHIIARALAGYLWIVGAFGMAAALFPMLFFLLQPLLPELLTLHYLLLPFYGLLLYSLWLYIVLAAARYSENLAPFIALTGSFLALVTYRVLGVSVGMDYSPEAGFKFWNWFDRTIYLFGVSLLVPLTAAYSSRLLGFFAASYIFTLLTCLFGDVYAALAGLEGPYWNSVMGGVNAIFVVTGITAGVLVAVLVLLRVVRLAEEAAASLPAREGPSFELLSTGSGEDASEVYHHEARAARTWSERLWRAAQRFERAARPLRLGLSCFGPIALLLNSLFWASPSTTYLLIVGTFPLYVCANVVLLLEALAFLGIGALLTDPSFTNTAATFLALWMVDQVVEAPFMNIWVAGFLSSSALLGAAWFITTHPGWIIAMLGDLEPLPPSCALAAAAAALESAAPALSNDIERQSLLHGPDASER